MGLANRFEKHINTLFFVPSLQETDHYAVDGHRTSVLALADSVLEINIPKGCNAVLAQAVDQNINYTLSGTDPESDSGFVLIAGNDPLVIPIDAVRTILKFHAAADDARLELQFGII